MNSSGKRRPELRLALIVESGGSRISSGWDGFGAVQMRLNPIKLSIEHGVKSPGVDVVSGEDGDGRNRGPGKRGDGRRGRDGGRGSLLVPIVIMTARKRRSRAHRSGFVG